VCAVPQLYRTWLGGGYHDDDVALSSSSQAKAQYRVNKQTAHVVVSLSFGGSSPVPLLNSPRPVRDFLLD
jgi:hypothetical protein